MINVALVLVGSVLAAAPCESLKSLALPGTVITAAEGQALVRPGRPRLRDPEQRRVRQGRAPPQ